MQMQIAHSSRAFEALKELIQGGHPLIYMASPEEIRAQKLLEEAARTLFPAPAKVWIWSSTDGLRSSVGESPPEEVCDARAMLDFVAAHKDPGIFQLKDFHDFMQNDPEVRRRLLAGEDVGPLLTQGVSRALVGHDPARLWPGG